MGQDSKLSIIPIWLALSGMAFSFNRAYLGFFPGTQSDKAKRLIGYTYRIGLNLSVILSHGYPPEPFAAYLAESAK